MKTNLLPESVISSDEAVLLLGSNQGNRLDYLTRAKHLINEMTGNMINQSSVYETAAWGNKNQSNFLNQAIIIKSKLQADHLLNELLTIEKLLGRTRGEKWLSRTIDIDILFYGNLIIKNEHLVIPHPRITERKFTLIPLIELIPHFIHPVFLLDMVQINSQCADNLSVKKYKLSEKSKERK